MHTQRGVADVEVEDAHHWRRRRRSRSRRRMDCEVQWMRMEQDSSVKKTNHHYD